MSGVHRLVPWLSLGQEAGGIGSVSTVVGFLCGAEDGDVLAMQCLPQGEGCIPTLVRPGGPVLAALLRFLLPPLS